MNGLEEIQEIIKNFIYEKQQMKQQITEIENERNKLAQDRNKRSFVRKRDDKKMKARVLRDYPDKITNRWYKKDEIVDFDEKRTKELIDKVIVEAYKEKKNKKEVSED